MDLFCGVFLDSSGEGITISPSALKQLSDSGIELQLDIYSATIEQLQVAHAKELQKEQLLQALTKVSVQK